MTVQKFITYNSLDIDGKVLSNEHKLELNVLEESGNYLIHRDILRHQSSEKQGTLSTKTRSEVRGGGVIFGPKPRKVTLKLNKKERKLALQTLLYNKRNNISVIDDLESGIESPKTKTFSNLCENCGINLDQKILVVVSKKTAALKLSTRNIKNVELISASSLNTHSLLKAKQILLTSLAVNEIKEIYCG